MALQQGQESKSQFPAITGLIRVISSMDIRIKIADLYFGHKTCNLHFPEKGFKTN